MSRILRVAAAQMGPISVPTPAPTILARDDRAARRCRRSRRASSSFSRARLHDLLPALVLEPAELDRLFRAGDAEPCRRGLVRPCAERGVGFYVGYGERAPGRRFNTAITVGPDGAILGKYRKVHLPGRSSRAPAIVSSSSRSAISTTAISAFRRSTGRRLGSPVVGMLICNDRRWPEAWRAYGLQGIELMLIGYNSAAYDPNGGTSESASLRTFHSTLVVQANAYMNADLGGLGRQGGRRGLGKEPSSAPALATKTAQVAFM